MPALAQFTPHLLASLDEMAADGIDTSGGGTGFLMTAESEAAILEAHSLYAERARRGWGEAPEDPMSGRELREAEPTLTELTKFGFMLPGEVSIDPVKFVASLIECITELGAEVRLGLTVQKLGDGASVVCLDEDARQVTISGDRVVLATGAWTSQVLRRSRIPHLTVVPGKGYSFTVPVATMPRTLIHSMDRHCVLIPMSGRLRVVGIMSFDGEPERFHSDRIDVLRGFTEGLSMVLTGMADLVAGRQPGVANWPFDLRPFAVRRWAIA